MTSRAIASSLSLILVGAAVITAQTRITPPDNNYSVAQDIELGREAAAQARQQLPVLKDEMVASYIEDVGRRLVAAVRPDLKHPGFRYSFDVVNVREINAFALPGGPMFVNRGMLEAARTEGEVAGVMAHEISHVVLRHGTAQASKATKYQLGELAGAVVGAIIGGRVGTIVAQGTQFGLGTAFLRFGREYERQADIEGAQIMARAGYDPRDMANMFKTIEKQHGSGGPEWLSDHPNPGNRSDYIVREAASLRVEEGARGGRSFEQIRARLRSLPAAPTTEQATRGTSRRGTASRDDGDVPTGRVEAPSRRFTEYTEGNLFRVSVPSNWRELTSSSAVIFAPDGAYGGSNGRRLFTHGVEIGIARSGSLDLETATDGLIASLSESNPGLGRPSRYRRATVGGRNGLETILSNASGRRPETIQLVTAPLRDGNLMYAIAVAPQSEFRGYQPSFQRVISSIRLLD